MNTLAIILAVLAATGWVSFWMAQDQTRGVVTERNDAWTDLAEMTAEIRELRRAAFLLPGDTPIGDEARRHLSVVRGSGGGSRG